MEWMPPPVIMLQSASWSNVRRVIEEATFHSVAALHGEGDSEPPTGPPSRSAMPATILLPSFIHHAQATQAATTATDSAVVATAFDSLAGDIRDHLQTAHHPMVGAANNVNDSEGCVSTDVEQERPCARTVRREVCVRSTKHALSVHWLPALQRNMKGACLART